MLLTVNTMKQASHYLLLCILLSLVLTSCHKDIEEAGETTTTPVTQVDVKDLTQGDVAGYIYDEAGAPMADVEVNVLNASTRTNEFGVFVFRDIDLDKNGTYIRANKSGYVFGSDMIYPDNAEINHSYIKMLQLTNTTTVNGANGGNVVVQGGGIISFPANSIANSDGVLHTGTVAVTAKRIAADDPNLGDVMPGALFAMDKDGFSRVLGTLGMVAVELRDANGNELNLADGVQATVQFPIAESQLADAPDQITLWSFDEAQGLWMEEGFANKDGNKYIGEVSHFSFWNCDAPFPLVHVCGTAINADGSPAANMLVQVVANVLYPTAYGYTDSDGRFCGKMPKGEELTITIFYPGCQEEGFTFNVGPFDADTELDPVTLLNNENGLITGTVYCDGTVVTNGTVVVNVTSQTLVFLTDDNGNYTFNTSLFGCVDVSQGSIFAFNNETNEASATEVFSLTEDSSIDLNTCGDCNLEISLAVETNDICVASGYYATATVTGGSGNFQFEWNNGNTTELNDELVFGVNCVTVTDADGCDQVSCIEFEFSALSDSLQVTNSSCEMNNGVIVSEPFGGTAPYTYQISGPAGDISTESVAENLMPGTYVVTVTDANNCSVVNTVLIEEVGGIPEFDIFQECGWTSLSISPNFGEFSILFEGVEYMNFITIDQSGFYCFDITNSQGCLETRCIDVLVQEESFYQVNVGCIFPNYELNWEVDVFNIFYNSLDTTFTLSDQFTNNILINPLEAGYTGSLFLEDDFQLCGYEEIINLPQFYGLSAAGNSPSCPDCSDGFIDISFDISADCFECQVGEVAIYDKENDPEFENDLTNLNQAEEMTSGVYYVIVRDVDSGCIIAHNEIILE